MENNHRSALIQSLQSTGIILCAFLVLGLLLYLRGIFGDTISSAIGSVVSNIELWFDDPLRMLITIGVAGVGVIFAAVYNNSLVRPIVPQEFTTATIIATTLLMVYVLIYTYLVNWR